MITAIDITVPVPDERTAEFYQFFGLWLAGSLSHSASPSGVTEGPEAAQPDPRPWSDTEQDFSDAETLWRKYSPAARSVFSLLMDHPDQKYTGQQIAEAVNIPNGAHGVAGVLAWPGRHGYAIGRGKLPIDWTEDPQTLETYYHMPARTAEVFKAARARVEAAG
jgi:hypothetical protein